MAKYVAQQIAAMLATVLAATFVVHSALYLAPGGPLSFLLGGRNVSAAGQAELEAHYHLDQSFLGSFVSWLGDILTGDLGTSIIYKESITSLLGPRIGVTAFLVAYAALLIITFGIGLGTLAGARGGKTDTAIVVLSTVGLAIPSFVAAVALISAFAVGLGWFPILGDGEGPLDRLWHLTLPAIALSLGAGAYVTRVTRAAIREEAAREHVQTARARGLPEIAILRRHVLRNALIPITTVGGVTIAGLIAGTVIVETAFDLDGLGSYLVQAIGQKDFPVVQAIVLIIVLAFVIVNTLVDVLYAVLDPRIREARRS